jgi:hypothetical protein
MAMVRLILLVSVLACAVAATPESRAQASAPASQAASQPASGSAAVTKPGVDRPAQPASAAAADAKPSGIGTRDLLILAMALAALGLTLIGARIVLTSLEIELWPAKPDPRMKPPKPGDAPTRPADGFNFRRHWGSFGGESTGWNISPRLTRLLSGLTIVAAGVWMLLYLVAATEPTGKRAADAIEASKAVPRAGTEIK